MTRTSRLAAVASVAVMAVTGLTMAPASQADPAPAPSATANATYKVLVVGKTLGYRHSHIDDTTRAVIAMGEENGFTVDVWDPAQPDLTLASTPFTSTENLSQYATILLDSPVDGTNNQDPAKPRLFNDSELEALKGYIHQGGGVVALHAATDAMHAVPWYSQMTGGGARFAGHPQQQTATMRVESPMHPSTEMLPKAWERYDEWYNFTKNPREDVHVLITLDESTYTGGRMGADHPISWCQNFEGGRTWYEGAGHVDSAYSDPTFLAHLQGGIEWTAGVVEGGGNCVTFKEVNGINDALAPGSRRTEKLSGDVAAYLKKAQAQADAGNHAGAVATLEQAKGKSHGLQDATIVDKINDLMVWQRGLINF